MDTSPKTAPYNEIRIYVASIINKILMAGDREPHRQFRFNIVSYGKPILPDEILSIIETRELERTILKVDVNVVQRGILETGKISFSITPTEHKLLGKLAEGELVADKIPEAPIGGTAVPPTIINPKTEKHNVKLAKALAPLPHINTFGVNSSNKDIYTLACSCSSSYFCGEVYSMLSEGKDYAKWLSVAEANKAFFIYVPVFGHALAPVRLEKILTTDWTGKDSMQMIVTAEPDLPENFYDMGSKYLILENQIRLIEQAVADHANVLSTLTNITKWRTSRSDYQLVCGNIKFLTSPLSVGSGHTFSTSVELSHFLSNTDLHKSELRDTAHYKDMFRNISFKDDKEYQPLEYHIMLREMTQAFCRLNYGMCYVCWTDNMPELSKMTDIF